MKCIYGFFSLELHLASIQHYNYIPTMMTSSSLRIYPFDDVIIVVIYTALDRGDDGVIEMHGHTKNTRAHLKIFNQRSPSKNSSLINLNWYLPEEYLLESCTISAARRSMKNLIYIFIRIRILARRPIERKNTSFCALLLIDTTRYTNSAGTPIFVLVSARISHTRPILQITFIYQYSLVKWHKK